MRTILIGMSHFASIAEAAAHYASLGFNTVDEDITPTGKRIMRRRQEDGTLHEVSINRRELLDIVAWVYRIEENEDAAN